MINKERMLEAEIYGCPEEGCPEDNISCNLCKTRYADKHLKTLEIEKVRGMRWSCSKCKKIVPGFEDFAIEGGCKKKKCDEIRCADYIFNWLTMDFKRIFNNLKEGKE